MFSAAPARPSVAQMAFGRHGHGGIGCGMGKLRQGISGAGSDDQSVQQPLGSDGLYLLH